MSEELIKKIQETTISLFKKAGFSCDFLEIEKINDNSNHDAFIIKIKSNDDCSMLLEKNGHNLKALTHILKLILYKNIDQKLNIIIDLNDFLKQRCEKIIELSKLAAQKVKITKKAQVLAPMSAYERRLVHLELASWTDVTTESIGEEPRRRIVIKPYP